MPKQITQFKLLVVTPSDVIHEMNMIQESVEKLNQTYGNINNADLKISYWRFDQHNPSFSEFDAVIVVLWTQLGTTLKENVTALTFELEAYKDHEDQLFLYFSDRQANQLQIDDDQYKHVLQFRSKFEKKSNCWTYDSLETFKRMMMNQLTLYFVKQLNLIQIESIEKMSNLKIMGITDAKVNEIPKLFRHRFIQSKFIANQKQKILDLVEKIGTLDLHQTGIDTQEGEMTLKVIKDLFLEPVKISEEVRSVILKYTDKMGLDIEEDDFFVTGNLLQKQKPFRGLQYGKKPSIQLMGTADEKLKYQWIIELYDNIRIFEQSKIYLGQIDAMFYLNCVLSNTGNGGDEEIEVKLYFDKGYLCKRENLPVPREEIIEMMTPSFELFFKPDQTDEVEAYNEYPEALRPQTRSAFSGSLNSERQKNNKSLEHYYQKIETYFCYEYLEEGDFDVIKYRVSNIKPYSHITLPTYLVFIREPRRMKYDIISKNAEATIQREVTIKYS